MFVQTPPPPVLDDQHTTQPRLIDTLKRQIGLDRAARQHGSGVALSSAHLFLTTLVLNGFGYLYWIAAAHLFSVHVVGYVSVSVSAMLLITSVGNMGMGMGLAYVLPLARHRWSAIVNTVLLTVLLCAAGLSLLIIFGAAALRLPLGSIAHSPPYLAVFVATTTVWTFGFVVDQILTVERATSLVLLRNGLGSALRLLILPVVLLLGPALATAGLLGVWVVSAVPALLVVVMLFARRNPHGRRLEWRIDRRVIREVVPLSLSNHVLMTLYQSPGLVLPLIVSTLLSTEANAYFYTTWMVSTILSTIPAATAMSLFAQGAARQDLSSRTFKTVLGVTLAAIVPLALGIAVARHPILLLFGAQYAAHGSGLLIALAGSAIPLSVCSLYISAQRIRRDFKRAFSVALLIPLTSLSLVYLAIPRYGLMGVGLALLGSYTLVAGLCLGDLWLAHANDRRRTTHDIPVILAGDTMRAADLNAGRQSTPWAEYGVRFRTAVTVAITLTRSSTGARAESIAALLQAYGPILFTIGAIALWAVSLPHIALNRMTDLGLVSVLPPTIFAALALLTAGFCLALRQQRLSAPLLLLQVLVLIVVLYGTTSLIEAEPSFTHTWLKVGVAEYIMRTGHVNPDIDHNFNWPSFYILSAFATRIAGFHSALSLAMWAPVFFNLLYLGGLFLILNAATADKRVVWLGVWFFYLTNWIGQDYFSPQGFNFFPHLVILGILLTWFRVTNADARPRPDRGWAFRFTRSIGRHPTWWVPRTSTTLDKVSQPWQRAALMGIILILFVVAVSGHALTPVITTVSLVALVVFNQCRTRMLPILMIVLNGTWISFMTVPWLAGNLGPLTSHVGQVKYAVNANVGHRLQGSLEHVLVVDMRLVMSAAIWGLAVLGAIRGLRKGRWNLAYALLALMPFPFLVAQPYGGEMLLRVYLFALPFMVFFAATLFYTTPAVGASAWTTAAIALVSVALGSGFLITRYGNERMDYFTPKEVQAVDHLYAIARPGSLLVSASPNLPLGAQDFEKYHYSSLVQLTPPPPQDSLTPAHARAVVTAMRARAPYPAYLIVTRAEKAAMELFSEQPTAQVNRWERALVTSGSLRKIYDNGDAQIFVLAPSGSGRTTHARVIRRPALPVAPPALPVASVRRHVAQRRAGQHAGRRQVTVTKQFADRHYNAGGRL